MVATVINFIIIHNDFNGMNKSFSLPLGARLFDELKQTVRKIVMKPDQKMFWNDGSSLCALNNSSDLEAAVHFALCKTKDSNKQPETEIYFERRETANLSANHSAAADKPNDSVIDNALAAIRGELEKYNDFNKTIEKICEWKRKIDDKFDDFALGAFVKVEPARLLVFPNPTSSEENVKLVMRQAGVERAAAEAALRKAEGDAAKAILALLKSNEVDPEYTIADDVQMVMDQACVSKDEAVDALELTGGDVIEAVVFLTA